MDRPVVLVAEPNALQLQTIDVLLAAHGFDLTLAETSEAALAFLRENTPAAALLAVELPDVDGYALCQKIKVVGRLARVPVVLVADAAPGGGLDDDARTRARTCGADLILPRPLGDKNLRERLLRLIRRASEGPLSAPEPADPGPLEPGPANPAGGLTGPSFGAQAASELGQLRAEVAHLRGENASLQARLAKYKSLAKSLQEQLDAERQKPKGLFGRRN